MPCTNKGACMMAKLDIFRVDGIYRIARLEWEGRDGE